MLNHRRILLGAASGGGYQPRAVTFDGVNDYLEKTGAYTSESATKQKGIISVWVKPSSLDSDRLIGSSGSGNDYTFIILNTDGTIFFQNYNRPSPVGASLQSSPGAVVAGQWNHILIWFDPTVADGDIYVNDVNVTISRTFNVTTKSMSTTWSYLFRSGSATPWTYTGDASDYYYNDSQALDFAIEANRRKFIDANGYPVDLGANGSLPTGSQPIVFLHLADGDAVSSYATNKGYGGGMTLVGALTEASTKPRAL